jgi:small subunit ribosomal protein S16
LAVKIRLKRMGSKKKPFYRIISTDSRNPRDGRFIETLGYYNPLTDPAQIKVDEDNIFKWLERGAVPTTSAASLLRQVGVMQKWQFMKQGVKKEDLDAKLEAMGVKTAPLAAPKKLKKAAKEKEAANKAKEAEAKEAEAKEAEAKAKEAEESKAKEAETAAAEPVPEEAPKAEEVKAEAAPEAAATPEPAETAAEPAPEEDKKEGDAS